MAVPSVYIVGTQFLLKRGVLVFAQEQGYLCFLHYSASWYLSLFLPFFLGGGVVHVFTFLCVHVGVHRCVYGDQRLTSGVLITFHIVLLFKYLIFKSHVCGSVWVCTPKGQVSK